MTHRDRVGDPPGRRRATGDVGHRQGLPTPPAVRPSDRKRRLPKAFGRPIALRLGPRLAVLGTATPRHALLAESLGKPSLWGNYKDFWYYLPFTAERAVLDTWALAKSCHPPALPVYRYSL